MATKITVRPIPESWLNVVVAALRKGDREVVRWTSRAQDDWQVIDPWGYSTAAYDYLLETLTAVGVIGQQVHGMVDPRDDSECQTWAFLCPNPLHGPPVYAKIGVHGKLVIINLFSLHVDTIGGLLAAMKNYYDNNQ